MLLKEDTIYQYTFWNGWRKHVRTYHMQMLIRNVDLHNTHHNRNWLFE